jgi:outer membrane protein OmpA-like peptidoglycan-associated protein
MATDWVSDVKKYAPDADDGVIAGIVRYCGIALQKVDSSLVSFSDPKELARVRNNFLKKKCGLTDPDDVLDAAIAEVGDMMKADRTKNRVTVYYLLTDRFGLHHLFIKAPKAAASKGAVSNAAPAVAATLVGAAAAVEASAPGTVTPASLTPASPTSDPAAMPAAADVGGATISIAPTESAPVAAASVAGTAASAAPVAAVAAVSALGLAPLRHPIGRSGVWGLLADGGAGKSGRLFWWIALGLAALAFIWLLFLHRPEVAAPSTPVTAAAPAATPAPAAPVSAAVPEGAGIVAETRDEKPVIKVYFATGKADVAPEFATEAAALKTYLDGHQGSSVGVSGYNDPTGNAAINAALSKKRAQAVKAALVAATIPEPAIDLIKPEAATDATVTAAEARRVEVFVK